MSATVAAIILRGDARSLPLPDGSVDLIVTSPPYFGLRSYTDGGEHYAGQIGSEETPQAYVAALLDCTREWVRVLKPSGSVFVNLGDKYAQARGHGHWESRGGKGDERGQKVTKFWADKGAEDFGLLPKSLIGLPWRYALGCIDDLGMILRAEVVWNKPNGLPESVTDRVRRAHEQVFHFTKQPRYYSAVDEIREAYRPETVRTQAYGLRGGMGGRAGGAAPKAGNGAQNPGGALPGSVWDIPSQPIAVPDRLGVDHFAAFPTELPKRCVLGWSPPGGVVLDPFGGTGTTTLVADVLGRTGISVDRSADYCRLAEWRTTDPGERCRVIGAPKPPPVLDGQESLFGEVATCPSRTHQTSTRP